MKYREKLGYIALGGVLMLIGMLTAGLFSPLGAKNHPDGYFRKVTCTQLTVVSPDLDETNLDDRTEGVVIAVADTGGYIHVKGIDSELRVVLGATDGGGSVFVLGDNSTEMPETIVELLGMIEKDDNEAFAGLSVDEDGGIVTVSGVGKKDRGVLMKVDKNDAYVMVNGANGSRVLD